MSSNRPSIICVSGREQCGGSLITEKVVLSAAHCANGDHSNFKIGLGLHNFSGYTKWTEKEWEKHIVLEVKEIIQHDKFSEVTV